MITKKQIIFELESLLSLRGLVEVYEEVAATQMQKVRGAVLQSRQFQEGLLAVFSRVKKAYLKQQKTAKLHRVSNGRVVAVFVAANSGLYGDIVDRVFDEFVEYVKKDKPDVVILGKLGVSMMEDKLPKFLYNYFDFSDKTVEQESFEMVIRYLIQFEKIVVFHGRFKTILSQDPSVTWVSGERLDQGEGGQEARVETDYLFEPSVDDVAKVFEGEILASSFEQTLHESQLAKFASRMLALDRSVDNIEKRVEAVRRQGRKINHRLFNLGQLATISGISLWGK